MNYHSLVNDKADVDLEGTKTFYTEGFFIIIPVINGILDVEDCGCTSCVDSDLPVRYLTPVELGRHQGRHLPSLYITMSVMTVSH